MQTVIRRNAGLAPPGRVLDRAALARAALFLLVCAPLWALPGVVWQGFPFTLPAVLLVTLLFLRRERRRPSVLGLEFRWRRAGELLGGLGGGVLLVGAIAAAVALALPFPWVRNPGFQPVTALVSFGSLLYGNAVEELLFRGYSFERLLAALGHWKAQVVTAVLFVLFHLASGWPWQAALVGTSVGSVLFGLVFVRWRSVPAAVGVHAAANWMRDLTLLDPPAPVTLFAPLAPRPWTGGEQLATALAWNAVTLTACALLWLSIRRQHRL